MSRTSEATLSLMAASARAATRRTPLLGFEESILGVISMRRSDTIRPEPSISVNSISRWDRPAAISLARCGASRVTEASDDVDCSTTRWSAGRGTDSVTLAACRATASVQAIATTAIAAIITMMITALTRDLGDRRPAGRVLARDALLRCGVRGRVRLLRVGCLSVPFFMPNPFRHSCGWVTQEQRNNEACRPTDRKILPGVLVGVHEKLVSRLTLACHPNFRHAELLRILACT